MDLAGVVMIACLLVEAKLESIRGLVIIKIEGVRIGLCILE